MGLNCYLKALIKLNWKINFITDFSTSFKGSVINLDPEIELLAF
jgi:hypothetical protein